MKVVEKIILVLMVFFMCGKLYAMGWRPEDEDENKRRDEARDKRIEEYIAKHPELDEGKKNIFRNRYANIGMTMEEVLVTTGEPDEYQNNGDIWVYKGRYGDTKFIFKGNILIEKQYR